MAAKEEIIRLALKLINTSLGTPESNARELAENVATYIISKAIDPTLESISEALQEVSLPSSKNIFGVIEVTDKTFDTEVENSNLPVLVDFWAPWCGPCRMLTPVVNEIAEQYKNQIKVVIINTDDNVSVASMLGIRSIPTLMLFKNGSRIDIIVGAVPRTTIAQMIERHL